MLGKEWAFYNQVRIDAGQGILARVGKHVPAEGTVLLVTTPGFVRRGVAQRLIDLLGADRVEVFAEVAPNPELDDLDHAAANLVRRSITSVVALGGGSVIDAAKALSVALPSGLDRPLHQVLRSGNGHQWQTGLPVIAIPTTSGTGAEVTPFATVWDRVGAKKYSVVGECVYPRVAILDPELTLTLPPDETLYTGLDAISHSLESLWNKNCTPVSEAFSAQALRLAIDALPRALEEPSNIDARARMQEASVLAGLAISQTRTAISHSISYPLTIHYGVPHGLACSFSLSNVINLFLDQNPQFRHRILMLESQALLDRLGLFTHLARYANEAQIAELSGEMLTPGRADNFSGRVANLSDLIRGPSVPPATSRL